MSDSFAFGMIMKSEGEWEEITPDSNYISLNPENERLRKLHGLNSQQVFALDSIDTMIETAKKAGHKGQRWIDMKNDLIDDHVAGT